MYSAKPLLEKVVKRNKKVAVVFKKKKTLYPNTAISPPFLSFFPFLLSFQLLKIEKRASLHSDGLRCCCRKPSKKKKEGYTPNNTYKGRKKKKKKKKKMKQKENAKERRRSSGEKRKQFDMLSKR